MIIDCYVSDSDLLKAKIVAIGMANYRRDRGLENKEYRESDIGFVVVSFGLYGLKDALRLYSDNLF